MEDKIEVGEYVRTPIGIFIISHINIDFDDNDKNKCLLCQNEKVLFLSIETIKSLKHSKIISEIVEVGDYVNGRKVKHIAMFEGFPDYPKLIFVDETHLIPDDTCENEDIKTILTKESYMANCYKVGGRE